MGKLRESSINFLQGCDSRLEIVEATNQMMLEKYEDWSKVLIEPSSNNLARIYALEARFQEEEKLRANDL